MGDKKEHILPKMALLNGLGRVKSGKRKKRGDYLKKWERVVDYFLLLLLSLYKMTIFAFRLTYGKEMDLNSTILRRPEGKKSTF